MTTRRRKAHGHGLAAWIQNQIWNTSLLWLIGVMAIWIGFYYDTKSTQTLHTVSLQELKAKAEETNKENTVERNKVREAFLQDSRQTANGIAELNKQTAVMNNALMALQRELEKIGTKLEPPPARSR